MVQRSSRSRPATACTMPGASWQERTRTPCCASAGRVMTPPRRHCDAVHATDRTSPGHAADDVPEPGAGRIPAATIDARRLVQVPVAAVMGVEHPGAGREVSRVRQGRSTEDRWQACSPDRPPSTGTRGPWTRASPTSTTSPCRRSAGWRAAWPVHAGRPELGPLHHHDLLARRGRAAGQRGRRPDGGRAHRRDPRRPRGPAGVGDRRDAPGARVPRRGRLPGHLAAHRPGSVHVPSTPCASR